MGGGCSSVQGREPTLEQHAARPAPPELSSGEGEVGIFWDLENLPPKHNQTPHVAAALRATATSAAPGCVISAFSAFVDAKHAGDAQLAALTENGVDCIHSVSNARKRAEASDKALALALLLWLWERGPRAVGIVLVTADHDFAPLLAKLMDKGRIAVVLVTPLTGPRAVRASLHGCGARVEDWSVMCPSSAPTPKPLLSAPDSAERARTGPARPSPAATPAPVAAPSSRGEQRGKNRKGAKGEGGGPSGVAASSGSGRQLHEGTEQPQAEAGGQPRGLSGRPRPTADVPELTAAREAEQLERARRLLAEAGSAGVLRQTFRQAYLQDCGEHLVLTASTWAILSQASRESAARNRPPSLSQYVRLSGVGTLVEDGDPAAARFVLASGGSSAAVDAEAR